VTQLPAELVNALRDAWAWASLHPIFFWSWIGCLAINNGLRLGAYRDYISRPPWARFLVAATDPACLNFWRLLTFLSDRAHLPFKFPSSDESAQIATAQAVRTAVAADDVAKAALEK
jgi:hypothetical protein